MASLMIWLVGMAVVIAAAVADVVTLRLIRHRPWPGKWRVTASVLLLVSIPVGWWSAFCWRYSWSEGVEVLGFPIPVMVFQWEDGRWVDYVGNPFLGFVSLFLVASAFLLLVSAGMLAAGLWRSRPSGA
jgi:hypothetical protein